MVCILFIQIQVSFHLIKRLRPLTAGGGVLTSFNRSFAQQADDSSHVDLTPFRTLTGTFFFNRLASTASSSRSQRRLHNLSHACLVPNYQCSDGSTSYLRSVFIIAPCQATSPQRNRHQGGTSQVDRLLAESLYVSRASRIVQTESSSAET